jgi:hypothetical protein
MDFFQRIPLASDSNPKSFVTIRDDNATDALFFEPSTPQRIIAGLIGAGLMLFIASLLVFGSSRGGVLDGMVTLNRIVMAGFAGLLGTLLLLYANPRIRLRVLGVGLLCTVGLISLPLFLKGGATPLGEGVPRVKVNAATEVPKTKDEAPDLVALRNRIGTEPLEEEITRLKAEGSTRVAIGLWLRELQEQHRFLIRDYILRTTGADPQSHYYPRGSGNFLMVVTGINMSIDDLAKVCAPLGDVVQVHAAIPIIEIKVRNGNFLEMSIEKLSNKADPDYYVLNLSELQSIDLKRVEKAVKRLMDSSPKVLRTDITNRLMELLIGEQISFKADVCSALAVWSEQPGRAGEVALKEAAELLSKDLEVPKEMIALVVKEGITEVVGILDKLWEKNPTAWESLYADVGSAAEAPILAHLDTKDEGKRRSMVRILGKVGGVDGRQALQAMKAGAEPELNILIDASLAAIATRASS